MTGPEHYREAERLITGVTLDAMHPDGSPVIRSDEPETIAAAQVHVGLAVAAALALGRYESLPSRDREAWLRVAATPMEPRAGDGGCGPRGNIRWAPASDPAPSKSRKDAR